MSNMETNWIQEMIERLKSSAKDINKGSLYLEKEEKIKLVKEVDFEAFKTIFLLVLDGVLDIKINIHRQNIRDTRECIEWRKDCLKRDKYICQECGINKRLEVHHIKPIGFYPEIATELDNGLTLCNKCHKKTDSYGGKIKNNYKKIWQKQEEKLI